SPNPAGRPELRHLLEEICLGNEIESEPVSKAISRHSCIDDLLDISNTVGDRECNLLHSRRASLRDVITADIDRIVSRHVIRAESDHVAHKAHRWPYGENPFLLSDVFFENVRLHIPG